MMKIVSRMAAAVVFAAGNGAYADPGPDNGQPGPYYSGEVELEYSFSDEITDESVGLRGDVRAGVLSPGNGVLQFGGEIGIITYDISGPVRLSSIEAVGFVTGSFGTVSLGSPFAADADFGPQTVFDRTVINSLLLVESRPTASNFMLFYQDPAPGARYDGSFGPVDVALSLHEFTQGENVTALSGAASFTGSFFTLTGEATRLENDTTSTNTFGFSAESGFGPLGGSFEVLSIDGDEYVYTIEGSYAVSDQFSVAAGLREYDFDGGGADTSWLVEAEYGFGNGAFLSATAGRTLGNREAAVGVGLEF